MAQDRAALIHTLASHASGRRARRPARRPLSDAGRDIAHAGRYTLAEVGNIVTALETSDQHFL